MVSCISRRPKGVHPSHRPKPNQPVLSWTHTVRAFERKERKIHGRICKFHTRRPELRFESCTCEADVLTTNLPCYSIFFIPVGPLTNQVFQHFHPRIIRFKNKKETGCMHLRYACLTQLLCIAVTSAEATRAVRSKFGLSS